MFELFNSPLWELEYKVLGCWGRPGLRKKIAETTPSATVYGLRRLYNRVGSAFSKMAAGEKGILSQRLPGQGDDNKEKAQR